MPRIERALLRAFPWLVGGLVASLPLLIVDATSHLTAWFLIHLSLLVACGIGLTFVLLDVIDDTWFSATGWPAVSRLAAAGASIVVLSTGVVGLVTLASSAALRYDPSTQFLQLLSALDIAWAGAALMVGTAWFSRRGIALAAGVVLGVFCVWSIWNYLRVVGFAEDGSWIVSGSDLMRYVIPFDMAAATVALAVFVLGLRARSQATEQPSAQS